ncbi:MAG: hypothetical protein ACKV2V_10270 [Blastocatellia bacterium]
MKILSLFFLVLLFVLPRETALAQKPSQKPRRPVKNQPQYPHILETDEGTEKSANPGAGEQLQAGQPETKAAPKTPAKPVTYEELMIRALVGLTREVSTVGVELRQLNIRQQAILDMQQLTRADLRVDQYERELKNTRDRLTLLEADAQNLQYLMKEESLNAQVASIPTFDRSTTMRQIKANHEARLRVVETEKEIMRRRENELVSVLEAARESGGLAEKRLQAAAEALQQLEQKVTEGQKQPPAPVPPREN